MRLIHEDSRRLPNNNHSWALGIWYYGWDDVAAHLFFTITGTVDVGRWSMV